MNIPTIINFLNILWTNISSFLSPIFSSNEGLIATFSALFGSLIGSITGYYFNVLLNKQNSKERYWVQRKNTLYSPIYKELLALKLHLENQKSIEKYVVHIETNPDKEVSYRDYSYQLWPAIKMDVRYDYIAEDLRELLEKILILIQQQDKLEHQVNKKIEEMCNYFQKNYYLERRGIPVFEFISLLIPDNNGKKGNEEYILTRVKEDMKQEYQSEAEGKIKELIDSIKNLKEYNALKENFDKLGEQIDFAVISFRKIISKIIKQYEGGAKI